MTDLATLTEGLKRDLAVPGEFDATYPSTEDSDLLGTLGDAFAKAKLDGYFGTQTLDTSTGVVTPDLSAAGGALIAFYAAESVLISKIRATPSRTAYESAGSKYEKDFGVTVLVQELKMLQARRDQLIAQALRIARASQAITMTDAYLARTLMPPWGYNFAALQMGIAGGFFPYELSW
jgi:hypothetical protein